MKTSIQKLRMRKLVFYNLALPGANHVRFILKPIMEKLSEEYKDKVNFYYADIDEKALNTATSIAGVRGVPTVVVYKKGVEVARKVGGVSESHMRDFLKSNI